MTQCWPGRRNGLLTFLSTVPPWKRKNLGSNRPTKQKERCWVFLEKPGMVSSPWMWSWDFIVWGLGWKMQGRRGPGGGQSTCWQCRGAEKQPQCRWWQKNPITFANSQLGLGQTSFLLRDGSPHQCQPKRSFVAYCRVLSLVPRGWIYIYIFGEQL